MNEKKTVVTNDVKVCMVTIIDGKDTDVENLLKILKKVDPKLKTGGYELIVTNQVVDWRDASWLVNQLSTLLKNREQLVSDYLNLEEEKLEEKSISFEEKKK